MNDSIEEIVFVHNGIPREDEGYCEAGECDDDCVGGTASKKKMKETY